MKLVYSLIWMALTAIAVVVLAPVVALCFLAAGLHALVRHTDLAVNYGSDEGLREKAEWRSAL